MCSSDLATNIPETLDKALFRRFDDIITYPLPDEKQILEFYKKQFVQVKKSMDLPFERLAKESIGLSFADIEKVTTDFRSEEHTSELQSRPHLVCRLLLEKKNL